MFAVYEKKYKSREELLKDSINGPQKYPMAYFNNLFTNNKDVWDTSLAGNLKDFCNDVLKTWDSENGLNLVVVLIDTKMDLGLLEKYKVKYHLDTESVPLTKPSSK